MNKLFIGFDANGKKIYLTPEDRATHMHVIGSSGSGKSKFLEWMIRGDIKNGQGLCLIDPHGTLYEDIVKWTGYHWLTDREIILLNPSSGDHVVGFNPFRKTEGDIAVQVDYQITATIRAWGLENTDETPTLERWLRCIFQALIEKNQTISAARYLINYFEDEVRQYLTSKLSKEIIRQEWRELSASKTPKQFQDEILSTKNKLFRFLCSDQIQRFMGLTEPVLDLGKIMDEGKILLVNLADSDELSRDNSRLFGALLVNEFFQQAKRRKRDQWGNPPKPFHLYIDEFQNFVTPDIGYILDQTRKFGLHVILAHQRLGQMEERDKDVIDAVLTNAKIKAVFGGLRRKDARLMVEEIFVNQLNLKEIKKAIYQTKFWPKYSRDKVYTTSHSHGSGESTSEAISIGTSDQFTEGEGWFGAPGLTSTTESQASGSASGQMEADTYGDAEADIPIFIPVPFKELTSEEYWSLEEQIWRMSDALKEQFPRHCFIKVLNQKTQPMLVPMVKEYHLFEKDLLKYQKELYAQVKALPRQDVDKLLEEQKEDLEIISKSQSAGAVKYPTKFRE
jgi:hypothetical protein